MKYLVILDRDGVINHDSVNYIKSPDEWRPLPNSLKAIALLHKLNVTLAVATNQSGVGRGYYSLSTLGEIHTKMNNAVLGAGGMLSKIAFCPHHPSELCDCRKPKPGMLQQIATELNFNLNPDTCFMVGDSKRDLLAGLGANCQPILVLTGNGHKTKDELEFKVPIYSDLYQFALALEKKLNVEVIDV